MPNDIIKDFPADPEPDPIEESVKASPLADVAPTLLAIGVTAERLQADLAPKEEPKAEPEIPAHHKLCAYEHLVRGDSIEKAALAANIPVDVAQEIADEIAAGGDKIAVAVPTNCRPVLADPGKVQPVEGGLGELKVEG